MLTLALSQTQRQAKENADISPSKNLVLGSMRHDFLSGNSISEPLTVSNDQMEKTVIAEKLIDFSFLINPKWKKTCSSLSRQCMWERRREERERGERIIIKITQINLGECSCHFSALSIRGKCRFTPASFVSNVSSNEDHQTTVLSHLKGGFSGHYSTCILPATSVGQNASLWGLNVHHIQQNEK